MKRKKESEEKKASRRKNGAKGGRKILRKYGKDHFRNLALKRHAKERELKNNQDK